MAPLKLIACDPLVGPPRKPFPWFRPDAADLDRELDRLRIGAAVVRHRQCIENAPYWGNDTLTREAATRPAWIPAFALTPDGAPEAYSLEATLAAAFDRGVRVAWINPREHMFSARPWCSGALYAACAAARLPLLLDYRQVTLDEIDEVMTAFPALRLVLLQPPRLGRHRALYTLLARHGGLCVCLNGTYSVHEGIAGLVETFGHERLVWGSGYPEVEGGASVALLTYASISDTARAAIAHGNIERLLAEVNA
jgi:predicted TIM-barrel fold metal-dependent hydrolase